MSKYSVVDFSNRLISDLDKRFKVQATKFTDEGFSHVVADSRDGDKLYKILVTETTIEKELPRMKIKEEIDVSPFATHYAGIGAVACRDWPKGMEYFATLYLSQVTCLRCIELANVKHRD